MKAAQPTDESKRAPRWAQAIGWISLALALVDVVCLILAACLLPPFNGPTSAAIAGISLPMAIAMPLSLFFWTSEWLPPLVAGGILLAGWCLLVWGGIGLLRRNSRGATVLLFHYAIVAAGNILLCLLTLLQGHLPDTICTAGMAVWPILVTVWMFRPSILKETASWAAPPPEREAENDR